MLPKNFPIWAIFFTAPPSVLFGMALLFFVGRAINPEISAWLIYGSNPAIIVSATAGLAGLWAVHCRVLTEDFRSSRRRRG